jgi:hypothetical protein
VDHSGALGFFTFFNRFPKTFGEFWAELTPGERESLSTAHPTAFFLAGFGSLEKEWLYGTLEEMKRKEVEHSEMGPTGNPAPPDEGASPTEISSISDLFKNFRENLSANGKQMAHFSAGLDAERWNELLLSAKNGRGEPLLGAGLLSFFLLEARRVPECSSLTPFSFAEWKRLCFDGAGQELPPEEFPRSSSREGRRKSIP